MSDPNRRANEDKIRLRVAISNAYAMVKSLASGVDLAQASPEQMMQERIWELVGPSHNPRRPSQLDMVRRTRQELKDTIEQIRSLPIEELAFQTPADTVNSAITPEEGTDATS